MLPARTSAIRAIAGRGRTTIPTHRSISVDRPRIKPSTKGSAPMVRKYSRGASKKVESAMKKRAKGSLRSGRSGKKVDSRKQAIAIGLSEARRGGEKVPKKSGKSSARKSTSRKSSRKSTAGRSATRKSSSRRKSASRKSSSRKSSARKSSSRRTSARKTSARRPASLRAVSVPPRDDAWVRGDGHDQARHGLSLRGLRRVISEAPRRRRRRAAFHRAFSRRAPARSD